MCIFLGLNLYLIPVIMGEKKIQRSQKVKKKKKVTYRIRWKKKKRATEEGEKEEA